MPDYDRPPAVLVRGAFNSCPPVLVPLDIFESGRGAGACRGNMVDTSDSRWWELVSSFLPSSARLYVSAVDVHDRVETSEQARRLSI
jgi:hypothetical protein